jgi:glutaredoxin
MFMELELYVRDGCSRCRRVKEALESLGIQVSVLDVDAPEVTAKARSLGIRSVPVLYKVETRQMRAGELTPEDLLRFLS